MPSGWRESAFWVSYNSGLRMQKGAFRWYRGVLRPNVAAVCQRCLEPFELKLEIEPKLLLLEMEQVVDGYEDFEVWELDEQTMRPQDIVEELLIMAMPFSAMHDNMADCKAFLSERLDRRHDEIGTEELVKPFAALRSQMKQNEKDPDDLVGFNWRKIMAVQKSRRTPATRGARRSHDKLKSAAIVC